MKFLNCKKNIFQDKETGEDIIYYKLRALNTKDDSMNDLKNYSCTEEIFNKCKDKKFGDTIKIELGEGYGGKVKVVDVE